MACTYDYNTGKITIDFHVRRDYEKCRLSGLPAFVGSKRCHQCQFFGGSYINWQSREFDDTFFTKCKHPDVKDSEGCELVKHNILEDFKQEALSHYYD